MTVYQIALIFLVGSGIFALICLGIFLLKLVSFLKELMALSMRVDTTLKKVNQTVDDVNYKLDLLNPPVELVNKAFTKKPSKGVFGMLYRLWKGKK